MEDSCACQPKVSCRGLRVVVGLILLGLVFVGPKTWWGLIGLLPLLSGITGFCPLCSLTKAKTSCGCADKESSEAGAKK
jgi:hypothetical protein